MRESLVPEMQKLRGELQTVLLNFHAFYEKFGRANVEDFGDAIILTFIENGWNSNATDERSESPSPPYNLMRERNAIEDDILTEFWSNGELDSSSGTPVDRLVLEVLLDIRELLLKSNAAGSEAAPI